MTAPRTRFAPSPTGFLHMGSARTALFNWAYARRFGGTFVLRIEDTDRERSTTASETALLEGLEWLGIQWDEGPYRQSERGERHAAVVEELLRVDRAYRCTCTAEELEERKQQTIASGAKWTYDGRCRDRAWAADCGPHTVRLRVPEDEMLDFEDLVYGPSGQAAKEIGDRIIRRSDGHPLYHLAVVVDDLDMEISHVIRGADHLPNTPFQIALYRALDREPPRFAHVPLIVGAGGKKLSKRRDPVSVDDYRTKGYLPAAVLSWLVRLGWSHGDQEIFTSEEIARLFDLDAVGRSAAQADPARLDWLNQHWLKELPGDELLELVRPFLAAALPGAALDTPGLPVLLGLLRERSHTLVDMAEGARFALEAPEQYDEKAARKHLTAASAVLLRRLGQELSGAPEWTESAIEAAFERTRSAHDDIGMGKLAQPVRVALTGRAASPGIFETVAVVPREEALRRLESAVTFAEATEPG